MAMGEMEEIVVRPGRVVLVDRPTVALSTTLASLSLKTQHSSSTVRLAGAVAQEEVETYMVEGLAVAEVARTSEGPAATVVPPLAEVQVELGALQELRTAAVAVATVGMLVPVRMAETEDLQMEDLFTTRKHFS